MFWKKEEKKAQEEPKLAQEMNPVETKNALSETREKLDELIYNLRKLQEQGFKENLRKNVEQNQTKLEKMFEEMATQKAEAEAQGLAVIDHKNLFENVYITPEELQDYTRGVTVIIELLNQKQASDWVASGGDQLIEYLNEYALKLKEALLKGQKLRANACIDAMKYAVKVINFENTTTQRETLQKQKEEQLKFVKETCQGLVNLTGNYYSTLSELEIDEEVYKQDYEQYLQSSMEVEAIPEEYKKKLDTLGFKNATKTIHPGDPIFQFYQMVTTCSALTVKVLIKGYGIESKIMRLSNHRISIRDYLAEVQKAFNMDFDQYSPMENQKKLMEFATNAIEQIKEIQAETVSLDKMYTEITGKLNNAMQDKELGETVANSMENIRKFNKVEEEALNARRIMAKNQKELEERKARETETMKEEMLQEEEAQRILIDNE